MASNKPSYSGESKSVDNFTLPGNKICLEYIWIDDDDKSIKSTSVIHVGKVKSVNGMDKIKVANGMNAGKHSQTVLSPVRLYDDPFLGGSNKLVLCEKEMLDNQAAPNSDARRTCKQLIERTKDQQAMLSFSQDYILIDLSTGSPLRFAASGCSSRPASLYATSPNLVPGRNISAAHLRACVKAGIDIFSANAGDSISKWNYETSYSDGLKVSDDLWMSRYILNRIGSDFGVGISFIFDDYMFSGNKARACVSFYTNATEQKETGLAALNKAVEKLSSKHTEHMKAYGFGDPLELPFSSGIGDPKASVCIPFDVNEDGHGHLEDRRPPAWCNPYRVCGAIIKTICVDK